MTCRNVFLLKIQSVLCQPKYVRKVSTLSGCISVATNLLQLKKQDVLKHVS